MITVFLGAGFSFPAGVPLARDLFAEAPVVDRVTRHRLVTRVIDRWARWTARTSGAPEEYLAELQREAGHEWHDAVWYVSLRIALKMGRVEYVGARPTITRHHLARTSQVRAHEEFWTAIFQDMTDVTVVTTNYDILPERGLRLGRRPRVPRPGFHYGNGSEPLAGGGYPSYSHIVKVKATGSVPLLKLHGSVSWSIRNDKVVHYHDCRPAIRGDALIVAPVTEKLLPPQLEQTWLLARKALATSDTWLIVGYSLPVYDHLVVELLRMCSSHRPTIHVFDPDPLVPAHISRVLGLPVSPHGGLPIPRAELRLCLHAPSA